MLITTLINTIKNNTYNSNTLKVADKVYIKELFEVLKTNFFITSLDLSHNFIQAEGATLLSETLKSNSSITSLYLNGDFLKKE